MMGSRGVCDSDGCGITEMYDVLLSGGCDSNTVIIMVDIVLGAQSC